MKKTIALILTVLLLLTAVIPIAAEGEQNIPSGGDQTGGDQTGGDQTGGDLSGDELSNTPTYAPTFEKDLSDSTAISSIGLDGNTVTELSFDETEGAMKVKPTGTGKAPARFRVDYPSGLKADESHIIAVVVKPSVGIHEKTSINTRTSGTNAAKSASATLGETTSKVETWGVKNTSPKILDTSDGYKILIVDLNDTTTYGKTSEGDTIELVKGTNIVSTFIDLLPYSGWTYDETVYFYVKSVCLFESEDNALLYYGFDLPERTSAYQVGDEFVSFWQADDTDYVVTNSDGSWKKKSVEGAIDGDALYCETQASSVSGSGFTFTFTVPTEGDYTVWGRVLYPNQNANSLHYSVDGGDALIWDFPDEDSADSDCYGNWHYFILTERKSGTYSDKAKYGEWTIESGDWRHSPNVLHLTAGQHTVKITGREAKMYIDQFVVTTYSADEYDPNACENNTFILESCKFCGTDVQHYYSDVYDVLGVSAHEYFVTTLHTDAVKWDIPAVTLPDGSESGEENEEQEISDENKGKTPNLGTNGSKNKNENNEDVADTEAPQTEAVAETGNESGCGASVGVCSIALVGAVALIGTCFRKKDNE